MWPLTSQLVENFTIFRINKSKIQLNCSTVWNWPENICAFIKMLKILCPAVKIGRRLAWDFFIEIEVTLCWRLKFHIFPEAFVFCNLIAKISNELRLDLTKLNERSSAEVDAAGLAPAMLWWRSLCISRVSLAKY